MKEERTNRPRKGEVISSLESRPLVKREATSLASPAPSHESGSGNS